MKMLFAFLCFFFQTCKAEIERHHSILQPLGDNLYASSGTKEFSSDKIRAVRIKSDGGRIVISAIESENENSKVSYDKESFDNECRLSFQVKDHVLDIESLKARKGGCVVNFDIKVPRATKVDITTGKSSIIMHRLRSSVNIQAGTADIVIDSPLQRLDVGAGTLTMKARGLEGDTSINCGNGEVELLYEKMVKAPHSISFNYATGNAVIYLPSASEVRVVFPEFFKDRVESQFQSSLRGQIDFNVKFNSPLGRLHVKKIGDL